MLCIAMRQMSKSPLIAGPEKVKFINIDVKLLGQNRHKSIPEIYKSIINGFIAVYVKYHERLSTESLSRLPISDHYLKELQTASFKALRGV